MEQMEQMDQNDEEEMHKPLVTASGQSQRHPAAVLQPGDQPPLPKPPPVRVHTHMAVSPFALAAQQFEPKEGNQEAVVDPRRNRTAPASPDKGNDGSGSALEALSAPMTPHALRKSPCFRTPAAAEVLVLQLATAAPAPAVLSPQPAPPKPHKAQPKAACRRPAPQLQGSAFGSLAVVSRSAKGHRRPRVRNRHGLQFANSAQPLRPAAQTQSSSLTSPHPQAAPRQAAPPQPQPQLWRPPPISTRPRFGAFTAPAQFVPPSLPQPHVAQQLPWCSSGLVSPAPVQSYGSSSQWQRQRPAMYSTLAMPTSAALAGQWLPQQGLQAQQHQQQFPAISLAPPPMQMLLQPPARQAGVAPLQPAGLPNVTGLQAALQAAQQQAHQTRSSTCDPYAGFWLPWQPAPPS